MVGLKDYKYGRKINHRRWEWNQIVSRLNVPIKDAVVLYLAGEDDDRAVALSKGFQPDNLIAVDIDKGRVVKLRKSGVNAICGDIGKILLSWRGPPKIDAILADFCGGIEEYVFRFAKSLYMSKGLSHDSIIVVNLMRGRDRKFSYLRKEIWDKYPEIAEHKEKKHRGRLFVFLMFGMLFYELARLANMRPRDKYSYHKLIHSHSLARFNTYISSHNKGLKFDSCAFNFMSPFFALGFPQKAKLSLMVRKIAAWKAIRTARLRGLSD